ncbi:Fanconi anemia group J protein isoform X2 [Tripterygium wilfordii]|uniref:DNA 5'-3' helicase FANCJ n=1 Tax=Tripterygium wilfordii TaxID=458696 RepID=A0A7J7D3Q8_TRIWF|nr:Fanconi anemia group J protein homolog isoform X2 [Tripterygium wilfordii]KAF5740961.1 Fanconi anemia group J protein isoform X2 [Tripterygium wilfordii]
MFAGEKNPKMVILKKPKSTSSNNNVYHIGGIQVAFPHQPYGTQFAFMGRVISTLDRATKDGHCHALLESPTGTGKTLSLLCSALAWLKNYQVKNQYANLSNSKPNPESITDPLNHGGGFIPESQPPTPVNLETGNPAPNNKTQKKKNAPTIYYSSRTHSQLSQVIREYKKTSYRVPMAVLASRKHYCTNALVYGKDNIDEECKLLLRENDLGCSHFKNVHKLKGHPSLRKGGIHEVHDIEDLLKVGQVVEGCPYYAARSMAEEAQLVFCPYNYVINPVIRGAMEVDIEGAIVILDEAHNIEDIARDAGSMDLDEDVLNKLQMELEQLSLSDATVYQPLFDMAEGLVSWIELRKNTLEKREFQHYCSCWTGDKALKELQEANISQNCFPILLDCATKAIKAATDTESVEAHLSGFAVTVLEGLFSSLTYFFSRNGSHTSDYQLALQRYVKREAKNVGGGWTHTISLWCLNPAVVFKDITNLSLSVILTSGTLSPMTSFSSELGVQFGTCMEAPHVIDVESQVFTSIITTGLGNYPLNASYKTADGYAFQDALGKSLEEICKIVPSGALVFFPSYKLMEKLCNRWRATGQWSKLNARKSLFVESRGGSQEDFEDTLRGYYASLHKSNKPAVRRRKVKKMDPDHPDAIESTENTTKDGAGFLAVCRGKVSEGIDFSDDNARVVIIVGIPFPNINDIQVALKKRYNDTYKTSKNLLSGSEWYCQQAFRALNQAAGRCIRHRFDYGAIILLDERFQEERNRIYISKWLRKSIQEFESFETSLEKLKSFFCDIKERIGKKMADLSPHSDKSKGKKALKDQSYGLTENKILKTNKPDHFEQNLGSVANCNGTRSQLNSQTDLEAWGHVLIDEDSDRECVELESMAQKDMRTADSLSMEFSHEVLEISTVKETPVMDGSITMASLGSLSRNGHCNSMSTQVNTKYKDEVASRSMYLENQTKAPHRAQRSAEVTPEKESTGITSILTVDVESSFNLSTNSHTQKRRKFINSTLVDLTGEQPDGLDTQTCCRTGVLKSSMANGDITRRIEFGFEDSGSRHQFAKSNSPGSPLLNSSVVSSSSSGLFTDRMLQFSCSLCRSPLGLPENNLYVRCSITSTSKVHLVTLVKERSEHHDVNTSTCIPVVMADISLVDRRLFLKNLQGHPGQGVWCQEDGCVFSTIFCPFCSTTRNSLGVQIMATDASNVQLLNKILFFFDCLEIHNLEGSQEKAPNQKETLQANGSGMDRAPILDYIDQYSYSPQQTVGHWRTTKSKLRLPKRS